MIRKLYRLICRLLIRYIATAAKLTGKIDDEWRKAFYQMAEKKPSIHTIKMLKAFFSSRIQLLKKADTYDNRETLSIICVEKDSLIYMKKLLPYYRSLGINHFIMIDDHSSDGVRDYLEKQQDVTLYASPCRFEHHLQCGWVLQAIQECGSDRWYLRQDADEFLSWQGMEEGDISLLLRVMDQHGMGTIRTLMLDMYPEYGLFDSIHSDEQFMDEYVYFDDGSSYSEETEDGEIFGGMRGRTAGAKLRMDKYVLFRPDNGYLPIMNHDVTGIHNDMERQLHAVLRHYKFLPSKVEKYREIVSNKNSGYGSFKEVKKYSEYLKGGSVFDQEHSIKWESSHSLEKLSIITPLVEKKKKHKERNLSIIIPHFNTPQMLCALLDSIGKNDDIQVIVVDDHSDRNLDEFSECKSAYDHVLFLETDAGKKGPGAARNTGLKKAEGKWILFADADDVFLPGWFTNVSAFFESDYDVIYFAPASEKEDHSASNRHARYEAMVKDYISGKSGADERLRYKFVVSWSKLIRSEVVFNNNICFEEVIYSEEELFSVKVGYHAGKITAVQSPIYCVTEWPGSLMSTMTSDAYYLKMRMVCERQKYLAEHLTKDQFKACGRLCIAGCLLDAVRLGYHGKTLLYLFFMFCKYRMPFLIIDTQRKG